MGEPRAVVVIPTFNEAENIPTLFDRLQEVVPALDILVVDDGSPDGTAQVAEQLGASLSSGCRVLRREGVRGFARSYVEGFLFALEQGYDRVVQMDADLSHDPAYIPAMLAEVDNGAGLVIGSRYCQGGGVQNWHLRRVLLSRYANRYVRWVTGLPTNDATAGFRCWTREALQAVDLPTIESEGYGFQVEMTYRAMRAGVRIAESPIVFRDRRFGVSKLSGHMIWEAAKLPWRLRREGRPTPGPRSS